MGNKNIQVNIGANNIDRETVTSSHTGSNGSIAKTIATGGPLREFIFPKISFIDNYRPLKFPLDTISAEAIKKKNRSVLSESTRKKP